MIPALERPDTDNYFRFYGIDEAFGLDSADLKKRYLDKSKQYHPDFFGDNPQAQSIAISVSAFNNLAYKTLSNEINRAQYLSDLKLKSDEASPALPQDFLMEMMDLNEVLDELTDEKRPQIRNQIETFKSEVLEEIRRSAEQEEWQSARIALLKWKYLERLETRII